MMYRRNTANQNQADEAGQAANTPFGSMSKRRKVTRASTTSSFTLPSVPSIPSLTTRPAIPSRPSTPSTTASAALMRPATPSRSSTLLSKIVPVAVEEPSITIAVMGATGSGKTTFINQAGNLDLPIGHGVQSCTTTVQAAKPFSFEGYKVTLIDTPGFDDDTITDTEVLTRIAEFLSKSYEDKKKLSGVVFLHRISDRRVGGVSRRNIRMFKELCGETSLKNVTIATTMWELVDNETGEAREAELRDEDMFFKPVVGKGANLTRHQNTDVSAKAILRSLIGNKPLPLQIQAEMVDQHKRLLETAAGGELHRVAEEQKTRDELEAKELQAEMKAAVDAQEESSRQEVLEEQSQIQDDILRSEEEVERSEQEYIAKTVELQDQLLAVEKTIEEDIRKKGEEVYMLEERLNEISKASDVEREKLETEIVLANRQVKEKFPNLPTRSTGVGYFASYGASIDNFLGGHSAGRAWW